MAPPDARERTPTSPSPSPEPTTATNTAESSQLPGSSSSALGSLPDASAAASTTNNTTGAATGTGALEAMAIDPDVNGHGRHQQQQNSESILPRPESEAARLELVDRVRLATEELYQLMTCASEIHEGAEDVIQIKINETMQTLQHVQDASTQPELSQLVPDKVMAMVDQGRNPDIHTRNFVNRLVGDNQQLRGQLESFDLYRDTLREKLAHAFPEMVPDLESIDARALPAEE